jgi:hypothetical protein
MRMAGGGRLAASTTDGDGWGGVRRPTCVRAFVRAPRGPCTTPGPALALKRILFALCKKAKKKKESERQRKTSGRESASHGHLCTRVCYCLLLSVFLLIVQQFTYGHCPTNASITTTRAGAGASATTTNLCPPARAPSSYVRAHALVISFPAAHMACPAHPSHRSNNHAYACAHHPCDAHRLPCTHARTSSHQQQSVTCSCRTWAPPAAAAAELLLCCPRRWEWDASRAASRCAKPSEHTDDTVGRWVCACTYR